MKDETRTHLHDILQAAQAIKGFVANHRFEDYASNELIRSATERKFEIMGEALVRIRREAPETLSHIREHRNIISFRNILIHGYDVIDDRIVWSVIQDELDILIEDVKALLT